MSAIKSAAVNDVSRRDFIRISLLAGGGFVLSASLPSGAAEALTAAAQRSGDVIMNAWLRIAGDNTVTIIVSQAEMGQGVQTTLPAVLANELGADWNGVKLENSPADPAYRNPRINWQFTGNSESTTSFFDLLRRMGASAREMLVQAAAKRWTVSAGECDSRESKIIHKPSGKTVTFGEIAAEAAKIGPPQSPRLRGQKEWTLIGKPLPRVEVPAKVDGSAVFGMDFILPNMAYAAVKQSPVFGGTVESFDDSAVKSMPGVIGVVPIPNGIAVAASSFWLAQRALEALPVKFSDGANAGISTKSLLAQYRATLDAKEWLLVDAEGNPDALPHDYPNNYLAKDKAAPARDPEILPTIYTQEYESPFMAHATMEPMNCTASVTADGVDIWAPTQGQEMTQIVICGAFNLPKDKVRVNRTLVGGGFGRRLVADFALQAALVSKQIGRPAKVIWSRDEDIQHDIYRPAVLNRITAGIDARGKLQAIAHRVVSPSILQYVSPPSVTDKYDPSCLEGLVETHYQVPNIRVDFNLLKIGVPTSVLRTTGYGPNTFAFESFIDELAYNKGQDPLDYRLELLAGNARALKLLGVLETKSDWRQPLKPGHARGIAFTEAFRTFIAHVVELSVDANKRVTIHKVTCVADPGITLDPGITTNSMEGGIAWGLTCAFKSEINFENGRTVQRNFNDYPLLKMFEMPKIEVHLIDSGVIPLGGTGEVGPVTVLPAVTNAIFAATNQRARSLPLSRHGYTLS
ncbi:MAG TPA: molybdopterin cofactor-binding domain-containing protein [Candidatus Angelobacter sp.]|nr:molybdopterin cofactor-binding domain-containing protein [Candidatus Angelobacter sp.]